MLSAVQAKWSGMTRPTCGARRKLCATNPSTQPGDGLFGWFLGWMDWWEERALPAIAPHWLQRAKLQGGDTAIALGSERVTGGIEMLDDSGRLALETAKGRR